MFSEKLQAMRFLHPQEASMLVSLPLDYQLPSDPRSALCLLGLISAHLQVVFWTYSQALHWADYTSQVCQAYLLWMNWCF